MNYQDVMREKYGCEFYIFCATCYKKSAQLIIDDKVFVDYDVYSSSNKELMSRQCRTSFVGLRAILANIVLNEISSFLERHPLEYDGHREKHILNISWGQ